MDLTVPYTFYPIALPHWIAWTLFAIATLGGVSVGVIFGRERTWVRRFGLGTFFVHDS